MIFADAKNVFMGTKQRHMQNGKGTCKMAEKRNRFRPLNAQVLSEFSQEMGTMLEAGVSLTDTLELMAAEPGTGVAVRRLYLWVLEELRQGKLLSSAMRQAEPAFPELMVEMIYASELTGSLGQTLLHLAVYYRREHTVNSRIGNALLYPKIIAVVLFGSVCMIVYLIFPQFARLFAFMEELPLPTRILFAIMDGLTKRGGILLVFLLLWAGFWNRAKHMNVVRRSIHRLRLYLPMTGRLMQIVCTARFARTLGTLYSASVPAADALLISGKTTGNVYLEEQIADAAEALKQGKALSRVLEDVDGLSEKLRVFVRIGEESGSLETMMLSLADILEDEAGQKTGQLLTILEPMMIVLMAVLVGFVMAAVLLPVYQSYNEIEKLGF